MEASGYIACGMYTPGPEAQRAWQLLFDRFREHARLPGVEAELRFAHDDATLLDPALRLGHTCGYPLMARLRQVLLPVCVPLFDVPGTRGRLYSSAIIVPAASSIESLADCRGKTVAINNPDSNSGMNLLRHALARHGARPGFFARVLSTGGHAASIETVADNRAQLAAIDCVSFQLVADLHPELVSRVRIIGYSVSTCGLPFVMPRAAWSPALARTWTAALNRARADLPPEAAAVLHLAGFERVELEDYDTILALESDAADAGYPQLN